MLSNISLIILREIIITINDYNSIINLKLVNKRLFKLINNDVVIKRHYLKLKYNVTTDDDDLLNLLESKIYSKFIKRGLPNTAVDSIFVNPFNDSFVLFSVVVFATDIFSWEYNPNNTKFVNIFLEKKKEQLEEILFSENYFLLGYDDHFCKKIFNFVHQIIYKRSKIEMKNGKLCVLNIQRKNFSDMIIAEIKKIS